MLTIIKFPPGLISESKVYVLFSKKKALEKKRSIFRKKRSSATFKKTLIPLLCLLVAAPAD